MSDKSIQVFCRHENQCFVDNPFGSLYRCLDCGKHCINGVWE